MRLIQAGLGGFGRTWATIARDAPGIALVAVVDPAVEARDRAHAELRLPSSSYFAALDDALTATSCEAVLVATPPKTHARVATTALRAGRHVLVEKPLATSLRDAQALVDSAARANRILMVSQNYRFRGAARAVQRLVADGSLGKLVAVKAVCHRDTRTSWPPENFRFSMRHPYLLDMAIHHFDLLRALTGQDVQQLYGRGWRVPDSLYVHQPAVAALMTLTDGAAVNYEGNWATHGRETSWDGDWELIGEAGRVTWTDDSLDAAGDRVTLERWGEPPQRVSPAAMRASDRAGTLEAFRRAVETGEPPETSATDNIRSLAIVVACVQSIERDTLVNVAELLASARTESGTSGC